MNSRSKYKTKQREILLDYLKSVPGDHITASDVCDFFKGQGANIGQSTVYRQLESLVDEGFINKYTIDANSPACFEYVDQSSHQVGVTCFHCKCERCGRLIHLHCDDLSEIQGHLFDEHKFKLDTRRTVFYGVCDECYRAE
ncbi:MAG: transcriptional repressor [Lachnospiraceae bacterium]|nr:transcriptional repressor [Lachnospiraceae bacterium]